jgi:phosphatidylserine/phosphatidylglycerophosphate/cardiolipin synthase-like enzyme
VNLLKANSTLPVENITGITNFDYLLPVGHPNQLRAIKILFDKGISVANLSGLHAKVLLIDDEIAILGSQNFTRRGRKNKEVSMGPAKSLIATKFLDTLVSWRTSSETANQFLVDELLSKMKKLSRQFTEFRSSAK